jgi:aminopeptidase N
MKKSGINIDWFLDQWIYKSGYPILEVKKWESQNLLYFNIQQTQKRDSLLGIFKFPLDIDVYWKDKSVSRYRIFIKDISDTLVLNMDTENKIDFAVIDPEYKLLKRLTFKRNLEEIFSQAQNAQHMIARYVALKELENIDSDTKREIFKSTYAKEKSHYIKEEILSQWAKDNNPTIEKIKLQALSDKHFKVRRAALVSLKEIKRSQLNQVRTMLSDSSYNNISLALEKLVEAFPNERNQFLDMTKNTMGIAKNVRIEWLRLQLKSNSSKVFYDELIDYISPSYEFRTRINAMNAISELNIFDASIAEYLVQATSSPNRRLSGQAVGVLKKYYNDETYKSQILKALSSFTGLDWQKDMVKAIKLD